MQETDTPSSATRWRKLIGLFVGPAVFLLLLLQSPPEAMPATAWGVTAVALWMAIWWISEAIPIPATALLPIVCFPILGVAEVSAVTRNYAHHLVFLFLGGFWIAIAMERWNLHRRIALVILRLVGTRADRIVLGFMLATAFLSMWISNTATAMLMLPIAMAVITKAKVEKHSRFATSLMLGIAYAASIGGVATLIGTPPNAILAGVMETMFGERITFGKWFLFGLPLAATMFLWCWFYLTRIALPSEFLELEAGESIIRTELQALGATSREERWVLAVFTTVALLWLFKGLIPVPAIQSLQDSTIAISGALLLFMIPVDLKQGLFLLDWKSAVRVPWEIILLFGGGFALAHGFEQSGLTSWIGNRLVFLSGAHWLLILLTIAAITIFLTEVTSNTASASMLLPIIASLSVGVGVHPFGPMVAAALAASFAFMLPVATPPNAIVYASGRVSIPQMARTGFWLNLSGILLILIFVGLILPWLWDFSPASIPAELLKTDPHA
jgi:sodium-dependent dicarboxylate transporter 2/3/5